MTVREWDRANDWPTFQGWFIDADGAAAHESHFPPFGLVVEDERGPLVALWVYECLHTAVAFPDWFVSRPGASPFAKLRAARMLLSKMEECFPGELLRIPVTDARIANILEKRFDYINLGPQPYLLKKIA